MQHFEAFLKSEFQIDERISRKLFTYFDADKSNFLSLEEIAVALAKLSENIGTLDSQMRLVFRLFDKDGDNRLDLAEMTELIEICTGLNPEQARQSALSLGVSIVLSLFI